MTDEEMAEEWLDKRYLKDMGVRNPCKEAFFAGLKAGRPKWHKVADGDLPKEQKEYWCKVFFYESEETFNAFLWFDPNAKGFKFLEEIDENVGNTFNVKAWCEIPK